MPIGQIGNWTNWRWNLDEMALDEMGLGEVAIPRQKYDTKYMIELFRKNQIPTIYLVKKKKIFVF